MTAFTLYPLSSASPLQSTHNISSPVPRENKLAISFACFSLNMSTLFPLAPPCLLLLHFHLLNFNRHLHITARAYKSSLPPGFFLFLLFTLRLLFISISSLPEVSNNFGNTWHVASDSAESPTCAGVMWKKQIVGQINEDTQCLSMWPQ